MRCSSAARLRNLLLYLSLMGACLAGSCVTDIRNALRTGAMNFITASTTSMLSHALPVDQTLDDWFGVGDNAGG